MYRIQGTAGKEQTAAAKEQTVAAPEVRPVESADDRITTAAAKERVDDTGFGGIKVIQNKGSGYGVDAVLLAAFAAGETGAKGLKTGAASADPIQDKSRIAASDLSQGKSRIAASGPVHRLRIADLGTGCGVAAFILHYKLGGAVMTGYDINANAIDRARRACEMNSLDRDITFTCTDIKDIICRDAFDAVISNPPYFRRTPGEPGAAEPNERYIARHETTADISDFAGVSARMLKNGGHLYMVHRPDRLADIICEMRSAGIEPKEMQLVVPSAGKAANIVLIHGVKGAGPEIRMLPEIAVHKAGGGYTKEILRIYDRLK